MQLLVSFPSPPVPKSMRFSYSYRMCHNYNVRTKAYMSLGFSAHHVTWHSRYDNKILLNKIEIAAAENDPLSLFVP